MLLPNATIFGALINLTQSCCSKWVGTPMLMGLVSKYRTIPICWFSYHGRCCLERWLLHPLSYQIPSIPCHSPQSIPSAPVPRQHGSKKPGRFGPRIRHILTWRKDVQRGNSCRTSPVFGWNCFLNRSSEPQVLWTGYCQEFPNGLRDLPHGVITTIALWWGLRDDAPLNLIPRVR